MAVSGVGDSYDLKYLVGALHKVATNEAPLFAMISGKARGTKTKQFQLQTIDNAAPSQDVKLEAATQAAAERDRTAIYNVTEIHHESVELSFTQQAVTDQVDGQAINILGAQPVVSEQSLQEELKLEKIASDIDYGFINGAFVDDTSLSTARSTRGVMGIASTVVLATETTPYNVLLTGVSAQNTGDTLTKSAHGLQNGDEIELTLITSGGAGLTVGTTYFVISSAADTWQVALTRGGAAVVITTDGTTITVLKRNPLTRSRANKLFRDMFSAGAKFRTPVIFAGAFQKQQISSVYAVSPMSRTMGGVNIEMLETEQGLMGVQLIRNIPADRLLVADLAYMAPVWLDIPPNTRTGRPGGRMLKYGVATAGTTDKTDFYCEIGLDHGPGIMHGYIDGLTTDEALV